MRLSKLDMALILLVLLSAVILAGCASGPPLTQDEIEYNRQMDVENWMLCETVYDNAGKITWHRDHSHRGRTRHWMIQQDLADNGCRQILKGLWAHSIKRGE